ncbi:MAG: hypothetical protein Q4Q53_00380 [Methanocorpusculum sp.]|nr:hypothetical protein [Methanocorpusculum sp.]
MINPFQILKTEGCLNEKVSEAFISTYGRRASEAIEAVKENRVKKYNDYFVVVGNSNEYCVDGDFCSCEAGFYKKECWHTLAVRIAQALGLYEEYNLWYYMHGVDEPSEDYKKD